MWSSEFAAKLKLIFGNGNVLEENNGSGLRWRVLDRSSGGEMILCFVDRLPGDLLEPPTMHGVRVPGALSRLACYAAEFRCALRTRDGQPRAALYGQFTDDASRVVRFYIQGSGGGFDKFFESLTRALAAGAARQAVHVSRRAAMQSSP
jgi:hypothetical protein